MASTLFSSFKLGNETHQNRLVMAPMTRCRATADHVPTPMMAEYYGARAAAGLLITEGVGPDANGCGYARIPGLWSEAQVEAWKPVTAAVHAAGGRIAAQLMHTGRVSHPLNQPSGARVLAPSVTQLSGQMYTDSAGMQDYPVAEAMTEAEVEDAIQGFVTAAKNAITAGFDLVELHGANGYLIDQFLTPAINQRADAWGGDITGRGRFAVEVARRVSAAIGADRVGIRLSPWGAASGITPWEGLEDDFVWLAAQLGALGIAYVHVVDHSAMGAPPVPLSTKTRIRDAFGGTVILAGGYDRDRAEADLQAGLGQLVAFGRPFLANSDLVARLRDAAPLNPPDFSTFYSPGEKGYLDYPTLA